jgi:hypothetical protein
MLVRTLADGADTLPFRVNVLSPGEEPAMSGKGRKGTVWAAAALLALA